jgi:hypothetical protein
MRPPGSRILSAARKHCSAFFQYSLTSTTARGSDDGTTNGLSKRSQPRKVTADQTSSECWAGDAIGWCGSDSRGAGARLPKPRSRATSFDLLPYLVVQKISMGAIRELWGPDLWRVVCKRSEPLLARRRATHLNVRRQSRRCERRSCERFLHPVWDRSLHGRPNHSSLRGCERGFLCFVGPRRSLGCLSSPAGAMLCK